MSTSPPDPNRRSFIAQLVRSFLEMVDEWRLLRADLTAPALPEQHAPAANNPRPAQPIVPNCNNYHQPTSFFWAPFSVALFFSAKRLERSDFNE